MANPSWGAVSILKGPLFLDLKDVDVDRDADLQYLIECVTDRMIHYPLNMDLVDPDVGNLSLQNACLKQCCYEYKQKKFIGLQSVQMQDGSINKYQISEWLSEVEKILKKYRKFVLRETV